MFVKTKGKGKVYYDGSQGTVIDDKRTYEVKATELVRELIRTGELIEADKPSDAVLKKYKAEDEAKAKRIAEKAKATPAKSNEAALKEAKAELVKVKGELEKANSEIAALKKAAEKAGDPKSEDLAKEKAAATSGKKETAKASNSEKA